MPTIRVPPSYRGPTHGEEEIAVVGDSVRACFDDAEKRYPGFREQVLTAEGEPHRFVRLFLNGTVLSGGALGCAVAPEDEITVLAMIAGG